jgi:diacylglycerol kinase (ATP)
VCATDRTVTVRISLLYNRDAGDGVPLTRIRELLEQHGHEVVRVVEKEADPERLLEVPCDLVVAAGGDGTVSEGARALAGRGIPLGILPLGTANNIASSLGICGPIDALVGSWDIARRRPLDLGIARGTWGERRFIEGVGGGLVPAGITAMQAQPLGEDTPRLSEVADAVRRYYHTLLDLKPSRWTIALDGTRTSGDYLLVEVLNIRSIGPNLVLSADANPSDGFFCVVLAGEEHREDLSEYLQHRMTGKEYRLSLPSQRAQHIALQGRTDLHVDDKILGRDSTEQVLIQIEPAALEYLA